METSREITKRRLRECGLSMTQHAESDTEPSWREIGYWQRVMDEALTVIESQERELEPLRRMDEINALDLRAKVDFTASIYRVTLYKHDNVVAIAEAKKLNDALRDAMVELNTGETK